MVYDILKRVEKRLSQKQAFMECCDCTRYRIPKDSRAKYLLYLLSEMCDFIEYQASERSI
jgi:hypothetical protein